MEQIVQTQDMQAQKLKKMTETPVERLVCKMAVPTIISMLVTNFYNMVDTMYVGHLDTQSTAAVGIVFSFMAIIQAIGFFFGQGSGNFISRELGRRNLSQASRMAATGFFSAFAVGTLIMILGLIFLTPFARFLGARDDILIQTKDYLRIILIGAPFMTSSLVLNNQLRLQGNALYAMIGIASGAVLNLVLDPLFIFAFHMGVAGAALATILSQLVGFVALFCGTFRAGTVRIHIKNFSPSLFLYRKILGGGLPSLCRQALMSIATLQLNQLAGLYGASAIAAFSIVTRISNFAGSAILGFGQGFQPVCGFNYGAGLYCRVKKAYWFCVKVATGCLLVISLAIFFSAPQLTALFRKEDPVLLEIASRALRYQCLSLPLVGFITLTNMILQNIGRSVRATVMALARQGMFFLPILFSMSALFGLTGLELSQPLADLATFLLSVPMSISVMRELRQPPAPSAA